MWGKLWRPAVDEGARLEARNPSLLPRRPRASTWPAWPHVVGLLPPRLARRLARTTTPQGHGPRRGQNRRTCMNNLLGQRHRASSCEGLADAGTASDVAEAQKEKTPRFRLRRCLGLPGGPPHAELPVSRRSAPANGQSRHPHVLWLWLVLMKPFPPRVPELQQSRDVAMCGSSQGSLPGGAFHGKRPALAHSLILTLLWLARTSYHISGLSERLG